MSNAFVFPELDYGDTNPRVFTAPGANILFASNFSTLIKIPGGEAWRIVSLQITCGASAVAGNRTFDLALFDADLNQFYTVAQSLVVTANNGGTATFTIASSGVSTGSNIGLAPLPNIVMLPTWSVFLEVRGCQAGDLISGITGYRIEISTTPSHASSPDIVPITPIVV